MDKKDWLSTQTKSVYGTPQAVRSHLLSPALSLPLLAPVGRHVWCHLLRKSTTCI